MRRSVLHAALALLAATAALSEAAATRGTPGNEAPIRLQAATFLPSRGEPALPQGLRHRALGAAERGTYIVQFAGPVEDAWKRAVAAEGAELLEYVPDFAFKVRMSPAQARRVRRLGSVRWVGFFHPAYKLSPRLERGGERPYVVRLEPDADGARSAAAIARSGPRVATRDGQTLVVVASAAQISALARLDDVAWIESFALRKKHNDHGGGIIMGSVVANNAGYDGSTQKVAIADTGLGGGTAATAHPDIPASRVAALYNWPGTAGGCFETIVNDGSRDVDTGHGTHVSVSAVGDGSSTGKGKGTAPGASLVFQSVENYATISWLCQILYGYPDGYYLTGIPLDIRQLFQQAYTAGARVHSNSWGSDVAGRYTADSANADRFVWSHRDLAITFSAGNAGVDADSSGGVDGDSMNSPATAKNVISVGASENDREGDYACDATKNAVCAAQGGQNTIFTWWEAWPFEFPAEPLKSDPSAGNREQMAAFSSRGPTDDGRIKPDVVAPGTWVLSGYSDLYQSGYDPSPNPQNSSFQYDGWGYPPNDKLKYLGGTSMANPLVAGGAAVVRDYYQKHEDHAASAALVKATLVNSAVDLLDEDNDGVNDNALAIPNAYEGWGRVDLAAATDGSRRFEDEGAGLSTGATWSRSYDVASGTPLKVTLVWSDYPGTSSATKMLVNDLDLEVSGPGGAFYRGNVFGRGWSVPGGLHDNTNNVENVFVQSPSAGTWTVTVRGYNVPQGPQTFAVVVAAQFGGAPVDEPPTVALTSPAEGATVSGTVTVSADASDDHGVTQVEFFVDGASIGADAVAPYALGWDTTTLADGAHVVKAVATDTIGQTAEDTSSVTVHNAPAPTKSHVGDLDGASRPASSRSWRADVTITVLDDLGGPVAGATVSGSWSRGGTGTRICVTDGAGRCGVYRTLANLRSSTVFTVSGVRHPTLVYAPTANADPDGDSDGTRITVRK
jgi:subtilisin family serine protease